MSEENKPLDASENQPNTEDDNAEKKVLFNIFSRNTFNLILLKGNKFNRSTRKE